jgi:hypothetical protein
MAATTTDRSEERYLRWLQIFQLEKAEALSLGAMCVSEEFATLDSQEQETLRNLLNQQLKWKTFALEQLFLARQAVVEDGAP